MDGIRATGLKGGLPAYARTRYEETYLVSTLSSRAKLQIFNWIIVLSISPKKREVKIPENVFILLTSLNPNPSPNMFSPFWIVVTTFIGVKYNFLHPLSHSFLHAHSFSQQFILWHQSARFPRGAQGWPLRFISSCDYKRHLNTGRSYCNMYDSSHSTWHFFYVKN